MNKIAKKKIYGIRGKIKAKRFRAIMKIFFKDVQIESVPPGDYYVTAICRNPRLKQNMLCSVSDRKASERDIVMWISDMANAYLQNEHLVLGSSPYIKKDDTGTFVYTFLLTKEF